jgi:hypothetical protein
MGRKRVSLGPRLAGRHNLCFGAANKLAIRGVEGRYVIVPNSDAFLCTGSLRATVPNINLHPEVAVAARPVMGDSLPNLSEALRLPA